MRFSQKIWFVWMPITLAVISIAKANNLPPSNPNWRLDFVWSNHFKEGGINVKGEYTGILDIEFRRPCQHGLRLETSDGKAVGELKGEDQKFQVAWRWQLEHKKIYRLYYFFTRPDGKTEKRVLRERISW